MFMIEFAHARQAVLRLLHGEAHEIVILGIDACCAAGAHLARQLARIKLDRVLAAAHRQAHAKAFGVDQVRFRRQADEPDSVPAEQELGRKQRAIGRAHDQKLVGRRHQPLPCSPACLSRTASAFARRFVLA
jgi:hypothetical protein